MKKILICLAIAGTSVALTGCSDWLDLVPKNEQIATEYWKTKEQVEEVLAQGYSEMRTTVPSLVRWGEFRGGSIYAYIGKNLQDLQNFQMMPSSSLCKWDVVYKVIGVANQVIKYAPEVQSIDDTYKEVVMNSNLAEAYFMRAWAYFTLVRNFKEVPLILEPYMTDDYAVAVPKSSEESIIAQVKADINAALSTGSAKEFYSDDEWKGMSKGRVTKWALYALMADVCLWSEDYAGCVEYADLLINSDSAYRPAFMSDPTQWFSIYSPGNSNESVFEINFDDATYGQTSNSPSSVFPKPSMVAEIQFSTAMCSRLGTETLNGSVRGYLGSYMPGIGAEQTVISQLCVWKYRGENNNSATERKLDANWILYRMADVLLMKAEALIAQGETNYDEAFELINQVRTRAGMPRLGDTTKADELAMMKALLNERDMELAAEGKRWYDLLRFSRMKGQKYKDACIAEIVANNSSVSGQWLRSVLKDNNAWYLPIHQEEVDRNPELKQNPYYDETVTTN